MERYLYISNYWTCFCSTKYLLWSWIGNSFSISFKFMLLTFSNYYNCVHCWSFCLEAIEKKGVDFLKDYITFFGGWPVIVGESWNPTTFNWVHTTQKMFDSGFSINAFINIYITINASNTYQRIIEVSTHTVQYYDHWHPLLVLSHSPFFDSSKFERRTIKSKWYLKSAL